MFTEAPIVNAYINEQVASSLTLAFILILSSEAVALKQHSAPLEAPEGFLEVLSKP